MGFLSMIGSYFSRMSRRDKVTYKRIAYVVFFVLLVIGIIWGYQTGRRAVDKGKVADIRDTRDLFKYQIMKARESSPRRLVRQGTLLSTPDTPHEPKVVLKSRVARIKDRRSVIEPPRAEPITEEVKQPSPLGFLDRLLPPRGGEHALPFSKVASEELSFRDRIQESFLERISEPGQPGARQPDARVGGEPILESGEDRALEKKQKEMAIPRDEDYELIDTDEIKKELGSPKKGIPKP